MCVKLLAFFFTIKQSTCIKNVKEITSYAKIKVKVFRELVELDRKISFKYTTFHFLQIF